MNTQTPELNFSENDLEIIRAQAAPGLSPKDFEHFIRFCQLRGLNPLVNECRAWKKGDRVTFYTTIDGFLKIAHRTGLIKGIRRGINQKGNKTYAFAEVWRQDWEQPTFEEILIDEYKADRETWRRMPEQMGKKCALAAALRMTFPDHLSGLYTDDELDRARQDAPATPRASKPTPTKPGNRATKKQLWDCIGKLVQEFGMERHDLVEITGNDKFQDKATSTELTQAELEAALEILNEWSASMRPPADEKAPPEPPTEQDPKAYCRGLIVGIMQPVVRGVLTLDQVKLAAGVDNFDDLVETQQAQQLEAILHRVNQAAAQAGGAV